MQDIVLALLAKEPTHGYQLRARLRAALGPLGETLNDGQIYVTLTRLERAGLLAPEPHSGGEGRDRKVYALTPQGQRRVAQWLADVAWPRPAPTDFHLKLLAASAAGLADPIVLIDAQRRELLRLMGDTQRTALAEPPASLPGLLLEGQVLRLQADLTWLDACEQAWMNRKESS
jgi:DNA-binding PadR family transcriptional regulator